MNDSDDQKDCEGACEKKDIENLLRTVCATYSSFLDYYEKRAGPCQRSAQCREYIKIALMGKP